MTEPTDVLQLLGQGVPLRLLFDLADPRMSSERILLEEHDMASAS